MYKIYGKENCEYCEKAKSLLDSKGIVYEYLEVGKDVTKDQLVAICQAFGVTPKTVPQIFMVAHDETIYVGGHSELVNFLVK